MTALKTLVAFLFVLALTVGVLCLFVYVVYSPNSIHPKVIAKTEIISPVLSPTPFSSNWHLVDEIVRKELSGSTGKYAVGVINLQTNERFFLNEHRKFQTASLYKLWVMTEAYRQIENNTLDIDTVLVDSVENLNQRFNIASDSAERLEGNVSMTVEDAINRMITYSDNYSALLLSSKLRLSNIDKFLKQNNFSDSKIGTTLPVTSAYDIALFYEKLYKNELGVSDSKMVDLLKKQQIKRKIPKYIPAYVTIAHKTGELDSFSHDAGIVYTPNGDYVIVLLSETNNPKAAEERISKISEGVYNFVTKQNNAN